MKRVIYYAYAALMISGFATGSGGSLTAQAAQEGPCLLGHTFEETLRTFSARGFDTLTGEPGRTESFTHAFIEQIESATGQDSVEAACNSADAGILYTLTFSGPTLPAASYRAVYFHRKGALDQGSIFAGDASTPYARIVNGKIVDCKVR